MNKIFEDGTSCTIAIQVTIYNPNFEQPLEFPSEYIGGVITSTRSINLGSSSLSIPLKMHNSYPVNIGGDVELVPYNKLFTIHSVIHLSVSRNGKPFRKLNAGVITSRNVNITPSSFNFTFNLKTKDHFIQEQEIFFDMNSVNESEQTRQEEDIEGAISGMADLLTESKSIKGTLQALWDKLFCKFLLGKALGGAKKFGGVNLITELESQDPSLLKFAVTGNSYTKNFIHILQFMSSINVGKTINLMDILRSYSSSPMYEIFVDSLESVGGDSSSPEESGSLSFDMDSMSMNETYTVKHDECVLVFRQTPFGYFDKETGEWDNTKDPFYSIELGQIKRIYSQESTEDYKSGVHVSLSAFEAFSVIMNYPKYNSTLLKLFGKKLLNVKLAGLGGKKDPTEKEKSDLKKELDLIRDMMFKIFCNPADLKTLGLSIDIPFNFVRIGVPLMIENGLGVDDFSSTIGNFGYIESVTDTLDPAGKATTSLSLKWGVDPSNTFKPDKDPVTDPLKGLGSNESKKG